MTRRRLLRSNLRRVAIDASIRGLILREFFFNRDDLGVSRFLIVFVTSRTRRDGDVGRQTAHARGTRDVDMTRGAFHHVLALAAFVTELRRNALRHRQRHKRIRSFVTTGAVVIDGLLIFPVASKTSIMAPRDCLEELAELIAWVRSRQRLRAQQFIVALMTDGAVVVVSFLLVPRERDAT